MLVQTNNEPGLTALELGVEAVPLLPNILEVRLLQNDWPRNKNDQLLFRNKIIIAAYLTVLMAQLVVICALIVTVKQRKCLFARSFAHHESLNCIAEGLHRDKLASKCRLRLIDGVQISRFALRREGNKNKQQTKEVTVVSTKDREIEVNTSARFRM